MRRREWSPSLRWRGGVTWEWVDLGHQRGEESERMLRFGVRVTRRLERWKSARQTLAVWGGGVWHLDVMNLRGWQDM